MGGGVGGGQNTEPLKRGRTDSGEEKWRKEKGKRRRKRKGRRRRPFLQT